MHNRQICEVRINEHCRGTTKELGGFISAVLMPMFFFAMLETVLYDL